MGLWVPRSDLIVVTNVGIVGSATPGTNLPAGGTTLTDGTVTEIISAANNVRDSWGVEVFITGTGLAATAAEAKVDILVGGATDDVLIPDLCCGYAVTPHGYSWFFPLYVPAGVRIAGRLNSVRTGINANVSIALYGGGIPPFRVGSRVTTYGTAINAARGQAITPTASGGAASVAQFTAATSESHFAVIPSFQPATDTTITPAGFVNVGIGIGASVEQRLGTWLFGKDTNEACSGPFPRMPAFVDVPAGSRLTVLASNSGANDSAYDGHIHAVS